MNYWKKRRSLRRPVVCTCLLFAMTAMAQTNTLCGQVKDSTGEPIIGATITANGKAVGVTDADGNYSISVPKGTELTITYVGMSPKQVTAADNQVVTLTADAKTLNDVVVIGYGVAKKNDLTGSVVALKPDTKNHGVVVNAQDLLVGKVPGVLVTSNDGTPGAGATMRIRGGSSLNASNDPLIVIDNVPIDNQGVKGVSNILATINPQDIESFNVLKDASATAIYGSRGSNGVIIITTKKGQRGKLKIAYNGSLTTSMKRKTLDVLGADEYRNWIRGKFGENSDAYHALGMADTDWQSLIYRTALSQDHGLTFSGSVSDILPYRFSVGYTGQQGILKNSDFNRYTADLNLSPSLLDHHLDIVISAKGMYARSEFADGGLIGAATRMDPTQDPYAYTSAYHLKDSAFGTAASQMLANFGGYFEWPQTSAYNDPDWPYTYNDLAPKNVLAMLNEQQDKSTSREFIGSADFNYKVHGFEDLRLHATLGADVAKGRQHHEYSPASPSGCYYGNYGYSSILKRNLSLSAYAQYYHDFNDALHNHVDIMGGYEYQHFFHSNSSDYYGFYGAHTKKTDAQGKSLAGQKYNETADADKTENYLVSFFGRANWSMLDRYYLTATVRDDGSSRFRKHWSWFPSFAFVWKINEEPFLRKANWLSNLKLRLGWGKTGQQDVNSDYGWIPTYKRNSGPGSYYPADGDGHLSRPENYTPDLKWETTTTYNVGVDWSVLHDRLSGFFDWYYRKTTDLLNYAPADTYTAYRNQSWQNIGSLSNTGVEAAISWKAIQAKDWYWTIDYNITFNRNRILDLSGASTDGQPVANTSVNLGMGKYVEYQQVGRPTNAFWVFQQMYDENGKPVEGAVVDRNADGQINDADRYFYKSPTAPVLMGLSSRLEWKNWDLSCTLRANLGNYIFDGVSESYHDTSNNMIFASTNFLRNVTRSAMEDGWTTNSDQTILTDRWIHNASFLKMDNITLGYSFSNLFRSGAYHGIDGRLYATASNVFCITHYKGIDPEVFNGYDNNLYPRPFSVIVGVNLNF
ncbi:MAG: SusC/RagA family TonB-linked outer membrane protein [Prevotella sp.]